MRYLDKKKAIVLFLLVAALLFAATALEWLFSVLTQKNPEHFPQLNFDTSSFVPIEFEPDDTGNNHFVTLANDAHFVLEIPGGIRAESIDIFMRRDENDPSEMVVYFTGESRGVYGTFVAGIKPTEEGGFRATARFDRIDRLDVYPTEITGTQIEFFGIETNRITEFRAFSVFRIPLWTFLLLSLPVLFSIIRKVAKKQKQTALWGKCYVLFSSAIALFALVIVGMYSFAQNLGPILIPISLILFTVFYLFLWMVVVKIRQQHKKVFFLFLFAASVFAFATAPLQVPDEGIYFTRSYAIASGSFGFDGKYEYPDDVEWLYHFFPGELGKRIDAGNENALGRLKSFLQEQSQPFTGEHVAFSNAPLTLPYLPSAIGIFLVRLFGGNALLALFAGRLMNVLMTALAAAFGFKKAVHHKTALLVIIFFPLTLFMAASFSYDAMLLSSLFIFIGILCSETIRPNDFALLAAAFAVMVMIKPPYITLAIMIFAVSKESFFFKRLKQGNLIVFFILIGAGVALWQLSLLHARLFSQNVIPAPVLLRTDRTAQLQYVLKNPISFLTLAVIDGFRKNFYLGEFGLFGHLDLAAPLTTLLIIPAVVTATALSSGEKKLHRDKRGILVILIIALYFVISLAFYIVDSVVGSSTILGIQARYFIPSVYLASALGSFAFSCYLRPKNGAESGQIFTLYMLFSVALTAAIETIFGYYL